MAIYQLRLSSMDETVMSVEVLYAWAQDVRDYALSEALRGHAYSGSKVVSGRTARWVTDDAAVASRVEKAGLSFGFSCGISSHVRIWRPNYGRMRSLFFISVGNIKSVASKL